MKYQLVFVLLILSFYTLCGQTRIEGSVKDEAGVALFGATVMMLQGEEVLEGGITDSKGKFQFDINLPEQFTLRVSYLGYADKDVQLNLNSSETDLENLLINTLIDLLSQKLPDLFPLVK